MARNYTDDPMKPQKPRKKKGFMDAPENKPPTIELKGNPPEGFVPTIKRKRGNKYPVKPGTKTPRGTIT